MTHTERNDNLHTSGYYCLIDNKKTFLEGDSFEEVCEGLRDDYILQEAIYDLPLPRDFTYGYGLPFDEIHKERLETISREYGDKEVIVYNNMDQEVAKYKWASLLFHEQELIEDSIDSGCIDVTGYALEAMSYFLEYGVWQCGLLAPDGKIVQGLSGWPEEEISKGNIKPAIWFGLEGKERLECWTLTESEATSFLDRGVETDAWKAFWFNRFWSMDWNQLWNDDGAIIWAFYEAGMEEPNALFEKVRNKCPIALSVEDSRSEMLKKVTNYCKKMYK